MALINFVKYVRNSIVNPNDRRRWKYFGTPKNRRIDRTELTTFPLADGCFIEVYWIDRGICDGVREAGPVAIVVCNNAELLMFDCFGVRGHYHISLRSKQSFYDGLCYRIWWPEKSVQEQIDRTIFELENNLESYVLAHYRKKVRDISIKKNHLTLVCKQVKETMLDLENTYRRTII